MSKARPGLYLLAVSLLWGGCATREPIPPGGGIQLAHGIEFDGPDGADLLKLDPRRTGVTLQDGSGFTLARFRIEEGRLRVQEAVGRAVSFVAPVSEGGLRITESPGEGTLSVLSREPDGDLRLVDGADRTLYEIKLRDYGLKVVDGAGRSEAKIRVKEGKTSVRDATGRTVLSTRDPIPPLAVACLALRGLPLSHRAGLALAVLHWGLGR